MTDGLEGLCRSVLAASWAEGERDGVPYGYTRPSPSRYPWQWYWDSCFAAIVWRRFDPDRSRSELESLLRASREDGFIGHVTFWDHPLSLKRRTYYNVDRRSSPMTSTIQPPLLAWAWRIAVGDPAAEPRIARHHEWLTANRDLEGDGLLWLIQPDESGLDSSPKFDPVWGWRSHARSGFPVLVAGSRRLGWDARRIRAAGRPVLCEVATNVLWGLSRLAMGEPSITPALIDRLWTKAFRSRNTTLGPRRRLRHFKVSRSWTPHWPIRGRLRSTSSKCERSLLRRSLNWLTSSRRQTSCPFTKG